MTSFEISRSKHKISLIIVLSANAFIKKISDVGLF